MFHQLMPGPPHRERESSLSGHPDLISPDSTSSTMINKKGLIPSLDVMLPVPGSHH